MSTHTSTYVSVLQVFDVYLWLGQQFPLAFVDIETAKFESKQSAHLVDVALRTFSSINSSLQRNKKNTTRRPHQIVREVGDDDDEEEYDDRASATSGKNKQRSPPKRHVKNKSFSK